MGEVSFCMFHLCEITASRTEFFFYSEEQLVLHTITYLLKISYLGTSIPNLSSECLSSDDQCLKHLFRLKSYERCGEAGALHFCFKARSMGASIRRLVRSCMILITS
jgi:hypothetical protein